MTDVATSELRANLSEWIRRAREGEDVVVTDRGVPVVRLLPVDAESTLQRLMREGIVSPPETTEDLRIEKGRRKVHDDSAGSDMVTRMRGGDDWP